MDILKKNQEKINSPSFILKAIFWALVVVFIFIMSYFVIPVFRTREFFRFVSVFGIIFIVIIFTNQFLILNTGLLSYF